MTDQQLPNVAVLRSSDVTTLGLGLSGLISELIAAKTGDREFSLYRFDDGSWRASIGNTCPHVMIGESQAEFSADGETPEAAVKALRDHIRSRM